MAVGDALATNPFCTGAVGEGFGVGDNLGDGDGAGVGVAFGAAVVEDGDFLFAFRSAGEEELERPASFLLALFAVPR